MENLISLEALAAHVKDGASLAVPADRAGVAMAATAAIIAAGPKKIFTSSACPSAAYRPIC